MLRRSKKSIDGKLLSKRRVSTSTTAPMAPCASSSHMNQKRFWPGVPNKYSTISGLIVMRPKSSATVVVCLPSTPLRSSTPTLASVRSSSVCSEGISLTELTNVVLPVPKPPATTILTAVGTSSSSDCSDSTDTIEHRLQ
jgi:hypothetical protein